jgi:hypothetical protein
VAAGKPPSGPDASAACPRAAGEERPGPALLREAAAAFRNDLPDLLRTHPGQWVAYRGGRQIHFGDSKTSLLHSCYAAGYRDEEIFVAKVQPEPPPARAGWA